MAGSPKGIKAHNEGSAHELIAPNASSRVPQGTTAPPYPQPHVQSTSESAADITARPKGSKGRDPLSMPREIRHEGQRPHRRGGLKSNWFVDLSPLRKGWKAAAGRGRRWWDDLSRS